ncbi:unnamed protein product, partial [Mesorhabditis belari]|uniref:Uncharacterized protein n=1 Tax=Mesorhabditis belari TaxID=2138241 RepID=A0AAF3ELE2_9BILA
MAAEESASVLLLKCVDEGRIDVLCSILSQLKAQANFHEEVDGILPNGATLLHHAVHLDSIDAINALLNNGANPCVQNDLGKTAFQMCRSDAAKMAFVQEVLRAITMSNSGRLCQLISCGVPVDSIDSASTKNTLLNWAADFGTVDIVRILCDSGATINAANAKGDTPLHAALRKTDEEIVRQLLSHGADPNKKNNKGEDAFTIAEAKGGALTSLLSMDTVTRGVRRSASVESLEYDRASILSTETSAANLFAMEKPSFSPGKLDSWTDLLWPQPTQLRIFSSHRPFQVPKDGRLKIYFDDASEGEPRQMMQAIQISAPLLQSCSIELEYRGHKTADHEHSPLDGKVTCGVYNDGRPTGSYCLSIENNGIEIQATDYAGVRYGFATLVQIIRIHMYAHKHGQTKGQNGSLNGSTLTSPASNGSLNGSLNSTTEIPDALTSGDIPALVARDSPSRTFRAVYQDFSGCRILNTETILQMATRLSYCKANYLFVNFEVRTTDRYQLPYTNRDLFHMLQVCDELFIKLVPSLDLQSSYIDASAARQIIDHFLDDFPLSDTAHFGPNLASILVAHRPVLASVQRRVRHIFLSVNVDEKNASHLSKVPPYVTLCVDGKFPFDAEKLLSPRVSLVLKFSVGDEGHLCAAPDSTAKKALLAAKLVDRSQILGNMICELSTGCEIMPPSLSYMPLLAAVGVSWNAQTDMRKFAFFLPAITAHHFLLDGDMAPLFEQASTLGKVEHTLTRYNLGLWKPQPSSPDPDALLKDDLLLKGKMAISVFLEMILNPENLQLDRLTPAIFKRARMELRKSARALDEARKSLPYNFELALVLAEIRLVTELLSLASRLGQSLCIHSVNNNYANEAERRRSNEGPWSAAHMAPHGRVGVSHLPLTIRTDLANTLLSIRTQFQHVWLSRSIPSTLPNALKMFDNLFKALLPPDLHEFGQQLL